MKRSALVLVGVMAAMSLLVSGCSTPIVGGGVVGPDGYAWGMGKLSFTVSHNVMRCHDATITALTELGVALVGDTTDMAAGGRVVGRTAVGDDVTITLEPQARRITRIEIRVGLLGDEFQSRKIGNTIKRHL
jgi:hypothetical protein